MVKVATWSRVAEELLATRYAALVAYANMLTAGDRATAEDITQDALVRVFGTTRRFEGVAHAEYYVRRAILSIFLDHTRRRGGAAEVPARADDFHRLLAELTPQERACVILRYVDDFTTAQIAERMRLRSGTVKRYLLNTSTRLATALGADGPLDDVSRISVVAHARPTRRET